MAVTDGVSSYNSNNFVSNSYENIKNKSKDSNLNASSKSSLKGYGNSVNKSAEGKAALERAIKELSSINDGVVTFSAIDKYHADLKDSFSKSLRLELYKVGVPTEITFDLAIDSKGEISVRCDDPVAKNKIEKYLDENPEVKKDFTYIQALGNLDKAKNISSPELINEISREKKELQAEAIAKFFNKSIDSDLMSYSPLLASFDKSSDDATFYNGLNYKV